MAGEKTYKKERRQAPPAALEIPALAPPPPLSDRERERIRKTIDTVKEQLPEVVPMIKDLVDAGLIHGWRNVFIK